MTIRIYHNPRCSKSRQTLALIEEQGKHVPEVILYLKEPPSPDNIKEILAGLQVEPRDIMRKKEAPYNDNNLDKASLTRDELINAICEHPILLERPIVLSPKGVRVGRPPEKVKDIL